MFKRNEQECQNRMKLLKETEIVVRHKGNERFSCGCKKPQKTFHSKRRATENLD